MTNNEKIRRTSAAAIERMVEAGVEVTTIATMLRISRQTVHRWLGWGLPPFKEAERIEKLFLRYAEIKRNWTDIVTSWDGKYHGATIQTLYRKAARMTLRSDLELSEKIRKLTAMTMNLWAKEGAK